MPKLLLRYAKEGRLRFLSHLEVAKLLERALRRSGLPLTISEGFHPKPKIAFGPALSLGATSTSEYAVVGLEREIPLDLVVSNISSSFIEGIRMMAAEYIPEGAPSIGKAIKAAAYSVLVSTDRRPDEAEITSAIARLFAREELVVEKESGVRIIKRTDAVLDAAGDAVEGGVEFEFLLAAGGEAGIRPASLAELIIKELRSPIEITGMEIERTGLFARIGDRFVDLLDYYKSWKPQ